MSKQVEMAWEEMVKNNPPPWEDKPVRSVKVYICTPVINGTDKAKGVISKLLTKANVEYIYGEEADDKGMSNRKMLSKILAEADYIYYDREHSYRRDVSFLTSLAEEFEIGTIEYIEDHGHRVVMTTRRTLPE